LQNALGAKSCAEQYAKQLRQRIRELGDKQYRQQFDYMAEMALLFVPN
jgi:hypothetical protein